MNLSKEELEILTRSVKIFLVLNTYNQAASVEGSQYSKDVKQERSLLRRLSSRLSGELRRMT